MAESTNTLAIAPEQKGALEVREQVNQIQYLMKNVLLKGTHYDTIKGCGSKPVLLQPGAEKIAFMFHLIPTYEVKREDFSGGHRAYDVTCKLTYQDEHGAERVAGYGMGECSTLESKYRYRNEWENGQKRRIENPDIADVWNTVMKMAKKRAFVDAVKSTTAASDIFTQDIEDMPAYLVEQRPSAQPVAQPQPTYEPASQLQVDLEPLRNLFQPYCAARQVIASDAMDEIAQAVGATSFKAMTQQQVNLAAQIMETAINSAPKATTNDGWESA